MERDIENQIGNEGGSDPFDLDSFFPHQVCINLDRRAERWREAAARFRHHGLHRVARFPAVDGSSVPVPIGWRGSAGAYGCLQSNLAVVRQARAEGWPAVLIFEDDVVFPPDIRSRFSQYIRQVPADWAMLFFGAMHLDSPTRVGENVGRLTASTSTYAYALKADIYDAFLGSNATSPIAVDLNNLELQRQFACYCFQPHLAWVECGHSDTEDRAVNPWWLEQSLVMGGPAVWEVAERTAIVILNPGPTHHAFGKRNLEHVVSLYLELLPGVAVFVVHQQRELDDGRDLPAKVQSLYVPDDGPIDRGKCFNAALQQVGDERQFFVFVDRDICPGGQVKAVLMMCRTYDFVSSFAQVVDLSPLASERLIADRRGVDTRGLPARSSATLCSEFCAFTRHGLEIVGGWAEGDEADARQTAIVNQRLKAFRCPGWTPRLASGPPQVGLATNV